MWSTQNQMLNSNVVPPINTCLDDYSLVDNDDFSTATERKIYVGCREESGDHNDDKKKEIFKIKLYSKEMNLRVLQLYDVVGVFYKPDVIHIISCSENIDLPITSTEMESIEELQAVCRQAMLGDDLAGQILLATMASEIYLRYEGLTRLNKIRNCPFVIQLSCLIPSN